MRYNYLGLGTFTATDYLEPQVKLDYATGAGANRYAGWDRFGRIVDLLWQGYGAESSSSSEEPPGLVHLQYGYDRASNRTHRAWRSGPRVRTQIACPWNTHSKPE